MVVKKDKNLNFRISSELDEQFSKYCEAKNLSKSEVLIGYVQSLCDNKGNDNLDERLQVMREDLVGEFKNAIAADLDQSEGKIASRIDGLEKKFTELREALDSHQLISKLATLTGQVNELQEAFYTTSVDSHNEVIGTSESAVKPEIIEVSESAIATSEASEVELIPDSYKLIGDASTMIDHLGFTRSAFYNEIKKQNPTDNIYIFKGDRYLKTGETNKIKWYKIP